MDYLFFNETIFQPVNLVLELSLQSTWVGGFKTPTTVAVGEEFTFGWRYLSSNQDYYFGWSQLKIGSLSQVQSFANNTPGGAIALNQTASVNVPEPSTLAIFALGLRSNLNKRQTNQSLKASSRSLDAFFLRLISSKKYAALIDKDNFVLLVYYYLVPK
jgi:hypothetical protein